MTDELRHKLLQINPHKPYVWRLRLSEDEYGELSKYIIQSGLDFSDSEIARLAIIYIAEWYKREYDGNVVNPLQNVSAESLWNASGLDTEQFVYRTEKTSRYLESIFVLGGLPMCYILKRKDVRLLKTLCRIYKGDSSSLEDNKDIGRGQALAFQESIRQQASLYHFLRVLLLNEAGECEIYAAEDLTNKSSLANQFVEAVRTAYDEVMRDKFKLEWIIDYNPSSPHMRRMLRLWLRPEELGGLNQYLRFERARVWGFPTIMRQRVLRISLLFLNKGEIVGNDDTRRTIMWFENSGQDDTGFEASGDVPWSILRSLPVTPFDCIKVIVTDDSGNEYVVQSFDCSQQYLQLWSMSGEMNRWSSTRNSQAQTAVLFSDYYTISDSEDTAKEFYDKTNGISTPWHFAFIENHVTLHHNGDKDITLWNRDGYIQFIPRLYTSVLQYKAGRVRYMYNEDPDIYPEPESEEWYYAVFCREDIKAYHFSTRESVIADIDEMEIQSIEFKSFAASNSDVYQEWTNDVKPPYGRLKLRLTIKDEEKVFIVLYLPSLIEQGADFPVHRDTDSCMIHYVDETGQMVDLPVAIPMNRQPLNVTIPIKVWSGENEFVELDAILPTLIKEVYLDGKVVRYLTDGEEFVLPYLLRSRVSIHDFNREGYSEYECFNVGVLREKGSVQKWKQSCKLHTYDISAKIPEYIRVAYGIPANNGAISRMLYWDYSPERQPEDVDASYSNMGGQSILFQDMRSVNDNLDCVPPEIRNEWVELADSDWDNWGSGTASDNGGQYVTLLRCYDIATMYKTYYFIFNQLFNIDDKGFISGICLPLRDRQDGILSEDDMQNLKRCATECGLDWNSLINRI